MAATDDDVTTALKSRPRRRVFDWITEPRPADLHLTPFQHFTLNVDWEKSPVGPMSAWPAVLKHMVLHIMQDDAPACIYWGERTVAIYNEAFTQLVMNKHPGLQGQYCDIHLHEIWSYFNGLLAEQRETGETYTEEKALVLLHRKGFLEETYFTYKFVPIIGDEGWILGALNTAYENTSEVIQDRRRATVIALSKQVSIATTIKELWKALIAGLQDAENDVPLALLYSCTATRRSPFATVSALLPQLPATCALEGCIGIKEDHPWVPNSIDFEVDSQTTIHSWIRDAIEEQGPVAVKIPDSFQMSGWRGLAPASQAVVCPIAPTNSNDTLAVLIIALNPRRPFDEEYSEFIHLITKQITTPKLSAFILHDEVNSRRELARREALDRERLYQELSDAETKFAKFAARAPIGLAILGPDGLALSANPLWRDLTMLEIGSTNVDWANVLCEGELELVFESWRRLFTEKRPITIQTKINRPWKTPDLDDDGKVQYDITHILLAMYPDTDEHDEVKSIMSCITDISSLKWTETQLRRKMDQAIETRIKQEKFIDMTSHEMRNPLSALIGCADEITTSLREYLATTKEHPLNQQARSDSIQQTSNSPHILEGALEAAETIIYCAMHQKRIIDDILTLSRLDSNLLLAAPEASQPLNLFKGALKMFDAEVKRADVQVVFIEHNSLKFLDVNWTMLDPSRVLQVFINLVTNAIKFTRTEKTRRIEIIMSASYTQPSITNDFGIRWVRKSSNDQDQTNNNEWGEGEIIYLAITVKDTGRGLSDEEMNSLFNLFQQANPKTHVQYGGSGLGLFISRQLTEMQGGEIGVASESGRGSTFQFYVKTRRTSPPPADTTGPLDVQMLVREDALREACSVEEPAPTNGAVTSPDSPIYAAPSASIDSQSSETFKSFHILVVEDNLVNQRVVTKQLRKAGHIVTVANHGVEALDVIRQSAYWAESPRSATKIHVVLMDLEMPVMDGLTCVRRIRELQDQNLIRWHVPVIAVTANARKDQITECLDAGVDDVTTKPYRMQDILKQIENLIAKQPVLG